jgi:hypothetical protein
MRAGRLRSARLALSVSLSSWAEDARVQGWIVSALWGWLWQTMLQRSGFPLTMPFAVHIWNALQPFLIALLSAV